MPITALRLYNKNYYIAVEDYYLSPVSGTEDVYASSDN
jgi:hypothetical protein